MENKKWNFLLNEIIAKKIRWKNRERYLNFKGFRRWLDYIISFTCLFTLSYSINKTHVILRYVGKRKLFVTASFKSFCSWFLILAKDIHYGSIGNWLKKRVNFCVYRDNRNLFGGQLDWFSIYDSRGNRPGPSKWVQRNRRVDITKYTFSIFLALF